MPFNIALVPVVGTKDDLIVTRSQIDADLLHPVGASVRIEMLHHRIAIDIEFDTP